MVDILYDGKRKVTYDDVVKRLTFYIYESQEALKTNRDNPRKALKMARDIRNNLEAEYKNNDLNRISKVYEDDIYFEGFYKPAIHESIASITGPLSYDSLPGFLYDVDYYMNYYIPSKRHS